MFLLIASWVVFLNSHDSKSFELNTNATNVSFDDSVLETLVKLTDANHTKPHKYTTPTYIREKDVK